MKKSIIFLLILVFVCCLCSCFLNFSTYNNQWEINLNYNNASNNAGYWLTTDIECQGDGSLDNKS